MTKNFIQFSWIFCIFKISEFFFCIWVSRVLCSFQSTIYLLCLKYYALLMALLRANIYISLSAIRREWQFDRFGYPRGFKPVWWRKPFESRSFFSTKGPCVMEWNWWDEKSSSDLPGLSGCSKLFLTGIQSQHKLQALPNLDLNSAPQSLSLTPLGWRGSEEQKEFVGWGKDRLGSEAKAGPRNEANWGIHFPLAVGREVSHCPQGSITHRGDLGRWVPLLWVSSLLPVQWTRCHELWNYPLEYPWALLCPLSLLCTPCSPSLLQKMLWLCKCCSAITETPPNYPKNTAPCHCERN